MLYLWGGLVISGGIHLKLNAFQWRSLLRTKWFCRNVLNSARGCCFDYSSVVRASLYALNPTTDQGSPAVWGPWEHRSQSVKQINCLNGYNLDILSNQHVNGDREVIN